MIIESFGTQSLQSIIPSYLYDQYSDDADLQAFVASFNGLSQGYLDWFNSTPLGVYVSPAINGFLLDWTAEGIYGISRPVIVTSQGSMTATGEYDSKPYNTIPFNGFIVSKTTPTSQIAGDDIYKRVLTWILYRGDGMQMSVQWLKRRIARFLFGANGSDIDISRIFDVSINDVAGQTIAFGATGGISSAPINTMAVNANKPKEIAINAAAQLIASSTNTLSTNTAATNENSPLSVNAQTSAKNQLFIYIKSSPIAITFQRLLQQGILPSPFQITLTVILT